MAMSWKFIFIKRKYISHCR